MIDLIGESYCVSLTQNNILSFEQYLPREQMVHITEDGWYGIGVIKDVVACGATMLWYIEKDKTAVVPSFMIDERIRRQGLGRTLYNELLEFAKSLGAKTLEIRLFMPEQSDAQPILAKEGFGEFVDEQWILEVPGDLLFEYLSDEKACNLILENCDKYEKNIVPFKKLSKQQRAAINAPGADEELSFAAVFDNKVQGYLYVSRLETGEPMIMESFVEQEYSSSFYALIGYCLNVIQAEIKKDGKLYIRASLESERTSLMDVAGDYFSRATLNYTCYAIKQLAVEEDEDEFYEEPQIVVSEDDYLLIRAQSVADMLAEEDYEVYFSARDGGLISVSKPETTLPAILLFYQWVGDKKDKRRMEYRLVASCRMPSEGEMVFPAEFMAQSSAMVNYTESDGRIIAKASMPEYGGVSDVDTIRGFIEEFWEEITPFSGSAINIGRIED